MVSSGFRFMILLEFLLGIGEKIDMMNVCCYDYVICRLRGWTSVKVKLNF